MVALIGRKIPTTGAMGYQAGGLGDVFDRLASTLADPLTPAIKRENLMGLQRENVSVGEAMQAAREGRLADRNTIASWIGTGRDPRHLGALNLYDVANTRGATAPETSTAAVAAGQPFQHTAQGVQSELSNRIALQREKEAGTPEDIYDPVTGLPTTVRRSDVYGQRRVLPLTQEQGAFAVRTAQQPGGFAGATPFDRAFIGAEPKADNVFVVGLPDGSTAPAIQRPDGFYHAQTGQRLPNNITSIGKIQATDASAFGKGDPIQKDLMNAEVGTQTALAAIDRVGASLLQPNAGAAVGWLGAGARWFNDVRAQLDAASKLVGSPSLDEQTTVPEVRNALDRTMAKLPPAVVAQAQQLGIDNVVLRSRITDLAYMIARAQNPVGVVSEPDFERAAQTVGGALFDPKAMTTVLEDVKKSLVESFNIRKQVYEKYRGTTPGGAPMPTPTTGGRIKIDANGNVIP